MTEGILIGGLVVIAGLVASYMKTHPFYRHKTQKYKERYQQKLQMRSQILTMQVTPIGYRVPLPTIFLILLREHTTITT